MYLVWDEKNITDFSDRNINSLYNEGYIFTRKGKGITQQTRSVRVVLSTFELSSENRRILRKTEGLGLRASILPMTNYHWSIGKMAKDFYEKKFGEGIFSANKIKDLLTELEKSHFNLLLTYSFENQIVGYTICKETDELLHYSYPFYRLETENLSDIGMGMMLRAILYAEEKGKKFAYLGSAQRPTDVYKLQFKGLEWWDGSQWESDSNKLKSLLNIV